MDKELTPFQAKILEILENRRFWALIGLFALLVLSVGIARYFMREQNVTREQKAAEKLFVVERMESEELGDNPSLFSADAFKKRAKWPAEKKSKMKAELESLVAEYPRSASAQVARIRLAILAYLDSNFDEALRQFREASEHGSSQYSDVTGQSAKIGMALILESQKKFAEAETIYKGLASDLKNPLASEALVSQARVLKVLGKTAELTQVLETIQKEFPNTYYDSVARVYAAGR